MIQLNPQYEAMFNPRITDEYSDKIRDVAMLNI